MYYNEAKKQELLDKYYEAQVREDYEALEHYATELYEAYGITPKKIW